MHQSKARIRIQAVDANHPVMQALQARTALRAHLKGGKVPEDLSFSDIKEWPENVWILDSPTSTGAGLLQQVQCLAGLVVEYEQYFRDLRVIGARIELLCSITTTDFVTIFHIPSTTLEVFCRNGIEFGVTITNLKGIPQSV
jgi:hypothetical protein